MSDPTPYSLEAELDRINREAALKPQFPPAAEMFKRIPPQFRGKVLDDFQGLTPSQEEARAPVAELLAAIKKGVPMTDQVPGLTLIGHPGLGKTLLACIVLNHAYKCRKSFDFVPVADFVEIGHQVIDMSINMARLDDVEYAKYRVLRLRLEQMTQVKILVLDDFGKEHSKANGLPGAASWAESEFDRIIRNRWNSGVGPTILTTNVFLDEWDMRYRESLSSFLRESTIICQLKERNDWRGKSDGAG